MSNKLTNLVTVDKEHFKKVLRSKNYTIQKLGENYEAIGRDERTIRRQLDSGEMSSVLLDNIAKFLNVHPDYLAGAYDDESDKINDPDELALYNFLNHDKFLYPRSIECNVKYKEYFENILAMNKIAIEKFNTLPPEERILVRQEIDLAILEVFSKHFTQDSLGRDLSEAVSYCLNFIGDYDPFSYYAQLEGIGLSESESLYYDDDLEESPLSKKYKTFQSVPSKKSLNSKKEK